MDNNNLMAGLKSSGKAVLVSLITVLLVFVTLNWWGEGLSLGT